MCEVADDLTRKPDSSPIRNSLRRLEMQLPQAMKQMANATPYSSPTHTSRSPTRSLRSSDTLDVGLGGKGGGHRKRVSADAGKFPLKLSKKRSNSTSNLSQIHVSVGGPGHSTSTRTATRSVSPNQMLYTHSEVILRLSPGGQNSRGSFQVPLEVLVLPISNDSASVNVSPRSQAAAQWDFALLSQDEVSHTLTQLTTHTYSVSQAIYIITSHIPSLTCSSCNNTLCPPLTRNLTHPPPNPLITPPHLTPTHPFTTPPTTMPLAPPTPHQLFRLHHPPWETNCRVQPHVAPPPFQRCLMVLMKMAWSQALACRMEWGQAVTAQTVFFLQRGKDGNNVRVGLVPESDQDI